MDRNTLLAIALSMLVFSAYVSYEAANQPPRPTPEEIAAQAGDPDPSSSGAPGPEAEIEREESADAIAGRTRPDGGSPAAEPGLEAGREIQDAGGNSTPSTVRWSETVDHGLYEATLSNRGAGLTSWKLLDPRYTVISKKSADPIELVTREADTSVLLATPLEELGLGDLSQANFEVNRMSEHRVEFKFEEAGITVRKILEFEPESYEFGFILEIENQSPDVIRSRFGVEWPSAVVEGNDFKELSLIALANDEVEKELVASVGSPGFFSNFFGGGDEGPTRYTGRVDWLGADARYFLSALMPPAESELEVVFEPDTPGKVAVAKLGFREEKIGRGETVKKEFRGFIGPKTEEDLQSVGAGLERSLDLGYSWLEPLTLFFHWLLNVFYSVIPNYGVAIILVTVLVRIVTLPIMSRQMKSMEKMRALQPRLKEIQELHKEDRQKQSEATMALYKETGVNPLGGCFPMLLQFPVFIGLFYALQSSIALRHAHFALWITDLSAPEELFVIPGIDFPVRVLPIVMGASMVLQQKMTPMTTMDPAQARMMTTIMPIMMTVLFYQFPSGLVLYWMISNFLGIGHQLWVGKKMRAKGEVPA